ncbi:hypothetical protein G6F66_010205 [Rhizopus arrhizus]|nr:hypothetical protein G6F66_010205 [Rhizopus arrhizus]
MALAANSPVEQTEYSAELLDQIPIKYILNHVETYQEGEAYKAIYSDMLAVSANLFPELFEVSSFLIQEGKEMDMLWDTEMKKRKGNMKKVNLEQSEFIFSQHDTNHSHVLDVLSQLEYAPITAIEGYANCMLSIFLPLCLDRKLDVRIAEGFVSAWESLNSIIPHSLWHTHFNSRNVLALTNAQDTAMLQLLLELCLETPTDKNNKECLEKSRRLICSFIHSIFIDGDREMILAKILHFQTYSTELIPIVVDLIPSLYIVLGFVPELTRQPQVDKQVFGILLACYLCEKYPLENYLMTAEKYVLPRLMKIAFPITKEGHPSPTCMPSEALVQAIPGFVHLARAFPHFGPQILRAFDNIAKGLPQPKEFIGQESSSKIILVLHLHKVLKDSRDLVQVEVDKMDQSLFSLLHDTEYGLVYHQRRIRLVMRQALGIIQSIQ